MNATQTKRAKQQPDMIPQDAAERAELLKLLRDVDYFEQPLITYIAEQCSCGRSMVSEVYNGRYHTRRKAREIRRALNAEIRRRLRKLGMLVAVLADGAQKQPLEQKSAGKPGSQTLGATNSPATGPAADAVAAMFPPKLSPLTRHLIAGPVETQHKARG